MRFSKGNSLLSYLVSAFFLTAGLVVFFTAVMNLFEFPGLRQVLAASLQTAALCLVLTMLTSLLRGHPKVKRIWSLLPLFLFIAIAVYWLIYGYRNLSALTLGANTAWKYITPYLYRILPIDPSTRPFISIKQQDICTFFLAYIAVPFTALLFLAMVILRHALSVLLIMAPILGFTFTLRSLPSPLYLSILFGIWLALLLGDRKIKRPSNIEALTALLSFFVSGAMVFGILNAFPIDNYEASGDVLSFRQEINSEIATLVNSQQTMGGLGSNALLGNSDSTIDLNSAGYLHLPNVVALRVHSTEPMDMYLRGYSAVVYENNRWSQLPEGIYESAEFPFEPLLYLDDKEKTDGLFEPAAYLNRPNSAMLPQIPQRITIEHELSKSNFLFTPYLLSGIGLDTTYTGSSNPLNRDSSVSANGQMKYTAFGYTGYDGATVIRGGGQTEYRALFSTTNRDRIVEMNRADAIDWQVFHVEGLDIMYGPSDAEFIHKGPDGVYAEYSNELPSSDTRAEGYSFENRMPTDLASHKYPEGWPDAAYMDFIKEHYTQIPDELRTYLFEWTGWEEQTIPYWYWPNAAAQIANLVSQSGTYTTTPGAQPGDRDFVEYFLGESHKGYCVHFASATTLLLRAVGIPARYVEGYLVSADTFRSNGWADVQAANAHAWTEIWIPRRGWVPVEATPGGIAEQIHPEPSLETDDTPPEEAVRVSPTPQPTTAPTLRPTPAVSPMPQPTSTAKEKTHPIFDAGLWITIGKTFAVPALFGLLCLTRQLWRKRRTKQFRQRDTNQAVLRMYRYLERLARFQSQIPQEAVDIARKARFSDHRLSANEQSEMLHITNELRKKTVQRLSFPRRVLFWILFL